MKESRQYKNKKVKKKISNKEFQERRISKEKYLEREFLRKLRFRRRISKSLAYVCSQDTLYFFQVCKVSQFFLIHFLYDVFSQFLYFFKFVDFLRFLGFSERFKFRKPLLKRYILCIIFSFYLSVYTKHYSLIGLGLELKKFLSSSSIFPKRLTIFTSRRTTKINSSKFIFLRWKCMGRLGWVSLARERLFKEYFVDWNKSTVFEEEFCHNESLELENNIGVLSFNQKKLSNWINSSFIKSQRWNRGFIQDFKVKRLTFTYVPYGFVFFWTVENFKFVHPLFSSQLNYNIRSQQRERYKIRMQQFWESYYRKGYKLVVNPLKQCRYDVVHGLNPFKQYRYDGIDYREKTGKSGVSTFDMFGWIPYDDGVKGAYKVEELNKKMIYKAINAEFFDLENIKFLISTEYLLASRPIRSLMFSHLMGELRRGLTMDEVMGLDKIIVAGSKRAIVINSGKLNNFEYILRNKHRKCLGMSPLVFHMNFFKVAALYAQVFGMYLCDDTFKVKIIRRNWKKKTGRIG